MDTLKVANFTSTNKDIIAFTLVHSKTTRFICSEAFILNLPVHFVVDVFLTITSKKFWLTAFCFIAK
jgi:hypothetical protein